MDQGFWMGYAWITWEGTVYQCTYLCILSVAYLKVLMSVASKQPSNFVGTSSLDIFTFLIDWVCFVTSGLWKGAVLWWSHVSHLQRLAVTISIQTPFLLLEEELRTHLLGVSLKSEYHPTPSCNHFPSPTSCGGGQLKPNKGHQRKGKVLNKHSLAVSSVQCESLSVQELLYHLPHRSKNTWTFVI